jgi:hypothetical protein
MSPDSISRLISSISDVQEAADPSVRLTVPVRPDQEEFLTRIARTITQNRDRRHRSQRITKASIIRAYIDALADLPLDVANINGETDLLQRIIEAMRAQAGNH